MEKCNVLAFSMAPPVVPAPLLIFNPEIVAITLPGATRNIRKFGVPPTVVRCTVRAFAPGPVIVRFLSITICPLEKKNRSRDGKLDRVIGRRTENRLPKRTRAAVIEIRHRMRGGQRRQGNRQETNRDNATGSKFGKASPLQKELVEKGWSASHHYERAGKNCTHCALRRPRITSSRKAFRAFTMKDTSKPGGGGMAMSPSRRPWSRR